MEERNHAGWVQLHSLWICVSGSWLYMVLIRSWHGHQI
jgi:hypothetical protein